MWPLCSPDINPVKIWGTVQQRVYHSRAHMPHNVDELRPRLHGMKQTAQLIGCADVLKFVWSRRWTFRSRPTAKPISLNIQPIMSTVQFVLNMPRFLWFSSPFSTNFHVQVSQGSAATILRCDGGKFRWILFSVELSFQRRKNFENRLLFGRVIVKIKVLTFF